MDNYDFFHKFNVGFAEGNLELVLASVTDDIIWNQVGGPTVVGKGELEKAFKEMVSDSEVTTEVINVIKHKQSAAVDGTISFNIPNQEKRKYAFCDIYQLDGSEGTRIKKITSYVIKIS